MHKNASNTIEIRNKSFWNGLKEISVMTHIVMTHIKVAVSVTCENQRLQSHIENVIKDALLSVGFVDVVRVERS